MGHLGPLEVFPFGTSWLQGVILQFRYSALPALLLDWRPRLVWIEELHLPEFIECLRSKILFIHNAVVTNYEGSHSCHAVLRRRRDEGKAADHYALHDKIHLTERRSRALSL